MEKVALKNKALALYQPKKSAPHMFAQQWEALDKGGNKIAFALYMEAGTAKTRIIIDNTAWLYRRGVIDALLVLAPNDLADQWIDEQIQLYLPEDIAFRAVIWDAKSARIERLAMELSTHPIAGRLHILAMNHEAMSFKRSRRIAERFLRSHQALFTIDESHEFGKPKSLRTKAVIELAPLAKVRRILSGTPFEKPFDLYSQFEFLDPRILGFDSFFVFSHHFGVFTDEYVHQWITNKRTGQREQKLVKYETLQQYQRLEELYALVDKYSYRKKLADCADMPEKIPIIIPTHLSEAQSALYQQIKEHGVALLKDTEAGRPLELQDLAALEDEELLEALKQRPQRISAVIKLVVNLRLQQCLGGFATDDSKVVRCIEGNPADLPRMQSTLEYVRQCLAGEGKIIIWAQFRAELSALHKLCTEEFGNGLLIDGSVTGQARADAIAQFKAPLSPDRILVAHPNTMGTGQNLQVARTLIYYSNGWRWIKREQSERRAWRLGQGYPVRIADLQARNAPLDARLLQNFKDKGNLVDAMMSWRLEDL